MRIVEQPGDSRSIYEDETVFELTPDFCANCIRASLFSICPNLCEALTTTCGTKAFLPVRPNGVHSAVGEGEACVRITGGSGLQTRPPAQAKGLYSTGQLSLEPDNVSAPVS
jgi:hypothetical protein